MCSGGLQERESPHVSLRTSQRDSYFEGARQKRHHLPAVSDYDESIPDLEIRNAVFCRFGLAGGAIDQTLPDLRAQIAELAQTSGAIIFDPRKSLCGNGPCINQIGGVSIYIDNNHIAASQIGILEDDLKQVLEKLPAAALPQSSARQAQPAQL